MINFKTLEIDDKQWIVPLLAEADTWGSHQNFTNLFAWAKIYNYHVARLNDYLLVKGELSDKGPYYFYPIGQGDIRPALEAVKQDALDCGHQFILLGLAPKDIDEVNRIFPEGFEVKSMRDSFDYVYLLEKLVTLSGKKLHAKRNHINKFKQQNSNWSFEKISEENIKECFEMNNKWCEEHGCEDDKLLAKEYCAVRRCFNYYKELGLEGGLLRLDGRVIAFTMGDKISDTIYDIHIEKAFGEIQGAYQMINREFAVFIQEKYPEIIYVNREEDMGYEGLRKAKLSYYPVRMEEKYLAAYIKDHHKNE
ncbi:MAG: phosphatidylglycerol lysyltransferase domain-containing protein [Desulfitobacteriaceae bacterium]|nr:phosphatidylglycerol lysyltransferase domain-containing protein [Desulfitobacteriaceae bacterium]